MPINALTKTIAPTQVDTVAKSDTISTLSKLSDMSLDEFFRFFINGALEITAKVLIALVVYLIGRWIIHRVIKWIKIILEKREVEVSLKKFILSFSRAVMMILLLLTIIGILGVNMSSFVALFASAGVAIGMALSGTLQNFAGGVLVLLLKPYRVGDTIEAQGQTGIVKEIMLFHTVLNTFDNKRIIIPNGSISNGIINNYSREGIRRNEWIFGIAYGENVEVARKIILGIIEKEDRILKDHEVLVVVGSLADSSVNIMVRAWAKIEDLLPVYFYLNEAVYNAFNKEGITIPFPQMDVHVKQDIQA